MSKENNNFKKVGGLYVPRNTVKKEYKLPNQDASKSNGTLTFPWDFPTEGTLWERIKFYFGLFPCSEKLIRKETEYAVLIGDTAVEPSDKEKSDKAIKRPDRQKSDGKRSNKKEKKSEKVFSDPLRGVLPETDAFMQRRIIFYLFIGITLYGFIWGYFHPDVSALVGAFALPVAVTLFLTPFCLKLANKLEFVTITSFGSFMRVVLGKRWYWMWPWQSKRDWGSLEYRSFRLVKDEVDMKNMSAKAHIQHPLRIGRDGMTVRELCNVLYDRAYNYLTREEREELARDECDSILRRIFERRKYREVQDAEVSDYYELFNEEEKYDHETTMALAGYYTHPNPKVKKILYGGIDLGDEYKKSNEELYRTNRQADGIRVTEKAKKDAIEIYKELGFDAETAAELYKFNRKMEAYGKANNLTVFDDDPENRPTKVIHVGNSQKDKKLKT